MFFNYSICLFFSFFLYFFSFFLLILGLWFISLRKVYFLEWTMIRLCKSDLIFPLVVDSCGLIFRSLVLYISANIFIFSRYYIEGELFISRFIILVVLFILSINFLIFIPHLIGLLLGWDGLGIVSFLLVIYYQNPKSLAAGILTALRNRIGDVLILLSISWCINQGHWIIININNFGIYTTWVVFSIILASITKSAQVPFSRWLPAAMAAPTPVRALVHSSTLVTAGVFLMVRFYPFLRDNIYFNRTILIIACITIFISGISAIFECDIKKVVALSTLRQLGVMISAIGLGFPMLAFFHLLTHALFKALLFVCVGSLINIHSHSQDLRFIGNLSAQLPLTTCCLNISNIALCGLPFLSGFYSKDLLIELRLYNNYSFMVFFLFIFSTILTSCYRVRLILTGLSSPNIRTCIYTVSDCNTNNTNPILMLCIGAIFGGCIINWLFICPFEDPCIPFYFKLLAFLVTLLGGYLSYISSGMCRSIRILWPFLCRINSHIWFIVPLSTQVYLIYPIHLGVISLSCLDQGWIEISGSQGIYSSIFIVFKGYEGFYNLIFSSFIFLALFCTFSFLTLSSCFFFIV